MHHLLLLYSRCKTTSKVTPVAPGRQRRTSASSASCTDTPHPSHSGTWSLKSAQLVHQLASPSCRACECSPSLSRLSESAFVACGRPTLWRLCPRWTSSGLIRIALISRRRAIWLHNSPWCVSYPNMWCRTRCVSSAYQSSCRCSPNPSCSLAPQRPLQMSANTT